MTVVVNSTPLIYLGAIGRFQLLSALYGRVLIPDAVYVEVVTQGSGRWGAAETAAATWIDRRTISDVAGATSLLTHLDFGESEVVVLADETHADLVIIDEAAGRRELAARGHVFIGTAGVLMQAKKLGFIPALKPELDQLRTSGFHLTDRVYQKCLALAGQ